MFQVSTTLFEKKFLLVSSLAACGLNYNGTAALLDSSCTDGDIHLLTSCAVDIDQTLG
jgi:hypothetical protein